MEWQIQTPCFVDDQQPVAGVTYVGPAAGDTVIYPDPHSRFLCEPCARDTAALVDGEPSGHACPRECTEARQVDIESVHTGYADPRTLPTTTPSADGESLTNDWHPAAYRRWATTAGRPRSPLSGKTHRSDSAKLLMSTYRCHCPLGGRCPDEGGRRRNQRRRLAR